jgi:hypothetical protein
VRGPRLCGADPGTRHPAGDDGCGGDLRVQLPGDPAAAGAFLFRRWRHRLHDAGRRHGSGRGNRGARHGLSASGRARVHDRSRHGLRRPRGDGSVGSEPAACRRRAGPSRCGQRRFRRRNQLGAAADRGTQHARPGDGSVLGCLSWDHADRRTGGRRPGGARGPTSLPAAVGRRCPGGGDRGVGRLRAAGPRDSGRGTSRWPVAVEAPWRAAADPGRGRAFESAARARTPTTPRRRTGRRLVPRSR